MPPIPSEAATKTPSADPSSSGRSSLFCGHEDPRSQWGQKPESPYIWASGDRSRPGFKPGARWTRPLALAWPGVGGSPHCPHGSRRWTWPDAAFLSSTQTAHCIDLCQLHLMFLSFEKKKKKKSFFSLGNSFLGNTGVKKQKQKSTKLSENQLTE